MVLTLGDPWNSCNPSLRDFVGLGQVVIPPLECLRSKFERVRPKVKVFGPKVLVLAPWALTLGP